MIVRAQSANGDHQQLPRQIEFVYGTFDASPEQISLIPRSMGAFERICRLPPLNAVILASPMTPEQAASTNAIFDDISKPVNEAVDDFLHGKLCRGERVPKLVIATREDSKIARRCREVNPTALWGIAINEAIAVVYGATRQSVILHEAFHLLGAEDCYDAQKPEERPGPLCGCPSCIMGYIPPDISEGSWPFLCQANMRRVSERLGFGLREKI